MSTDTMLYIWIAVMLFSTIAALLRLTLNTYASFTDNDAACQVWVFTMAASILPLYIVLCPEWMLMFFVGALFVVLVILGGFAAFCHVDR